MATQEPAAVRRPAGGVRRRVPTGALAADLCRFFAATDTTAFRLTRSAAMPTRRTAARSISRLESARSVARPRRVGGRLFTRLGRYVPLGSELCDGVVSLGHVDRLHRLFYCRPVDRRDKKGAPDAIAYAAGAKKDGSEG